MPPCPSCLTAHSQVTQLLHPASNQRTITRRQCHTVTSHIEPSACRRCEEVVTPRFLWLILYRDDEVPGKPSEVLSDVCILYPPFIPEPHPGGTHPQTTLRLIEKAGQDCPTTVCAMAERWQPPRGPPTGESAVLCTCLPGGHIGLLILPSDNPVTERGIQGPSPRAPVGAVTAPGNGTQQGTLWMPGQDPPLPLPPLCRPPSLFSFPSSFPPHPPHLLWERLLCGSHVMWRGPT